MWLLRCVLVLVLVLVVGLCVGCILPHDEPTDKDGDLGLRELLDIQKLEDDIQNVLTPSLLFRCV